MLCRSVCKPRCLSIVEPESGKLDPENRIRQIRQKCNNLTKVHRFGDRVENEPVPVSNGFYSNTTGYFPGQTSTPKCPRTITFYRFVGKGKPSTATSILVTDFYDDFQMIEHWKSHQHNDSAVSVIKLSSWSHQHHCSPCYHLVFRIDYTV